MSYIIAFISFENSSKEFPVQCFRTDLKSGDKVVVRRADGKLRLAMIQRLKYLNWDCNSRIECKLDEATQKSDGEIVLPKASPLIYGISTADTFIRELKSQGWTSVKYINRTYRAVLGNSNESSISYILVRKNGLDIQIISCNNNEPIQPFGIYSRSLSEGKVVRHSLAHTSFNLFEGILRFSKIFIDDETDLDRYFVPQGCSDKRTEELKKQAEERGVERKRIKAERDYNSIEVVGDYPDDMYLGYHMK